MKKSKIVLGIVLGLMLITVIVYGLVNTISVTDPTISAVIKTEIPMLTTSSVGTSLNGGLTITAPNTPGHWESKYGYFTDSKEVKFCLIETIGINKFTFIPDNSNIKASSVYSIVFVWREHMTEIILALVLIALIVLLYMSTRISSAPKERKKPTTT